jgi:hypothetical protein
MKHKSKFTPEERSRIDTIRAENGADPISEYEIEWWEEYATADDWDELRDELRK